MCVLVWLTVAPCCWASCTEASTRLLSASPGRPTHFIPAIRSLRRATTRSNTPSCTHSTHWTWGTGEGGRTDEETVRGCGSTRFVFHENHLFLLLEGGLDHSVYGAVDVRRLENDEGTRGTDAGGEGDGKAHPSCGLTQRHSVLKGKENIMYLRILHSPLHETPRSYTHLLVAAVGDQADAGVLGHFGTQRHVTSC